MAREILGCEGRECADHVNHNTLDHRRSNLRKATYFENAYNRIIKVANKSGFRGVSPVSLSYKWQARIRHQGTEIYLGCFNSLEEAARAYDDAARKFHGEFANLNFPAASAL